MFLSQKEKHLLFVAVCLVAAVFAVFLLIQCTSNNTESVSPSDEVVQTEVYSGLQNITSSFDKAEDTPSAMALNIPIEWEHGTYGDSIQCTVIGISAVRNINDAGIDIKDMNYSSYIHLIGSEKPLRHPHYSNPRGKEFECYIDAETGELADNVYLILVNLSVQNVSATNAGNS